MKTAITILAMAVFGAAHAQLWDQSQLVQAANVGVGPAGSNISMLEAGETIFGYGAQSTTGINNSMADDFVVGGGGWNVTSIDFYTYQTGAPTSGTITGGNYTINAGSAALPTTAFVVGGGATQTWTNAYRTNVGDITSTNRAIMRVTLSGLSINLAPGTYWLSYQFGGTLASGPWNPPLPTSLAINGKNAMQSITGGAFAAVLQGPVGADASFRINGTIVPEPATMAVLGFGALVAMRRRRK